MSLLNKASLIQIPSGYKDGTLYSAKPTNGDGDFTFSRGSNLAATRINSEGLIEKGRENLLLQSNSFDTTWVNASSSETSGQTGYDGSSDAWLLSKSGSNGRIYQNVAVSNVNTFSVYAKANTLNWVSLWTNIGTSYFDLENGVVGNITASTSITSNIESVGNGWYRCSFVFNTTISQVRIYPADGNLDTSGTSGSIYIQDAQLEVGLVATDYIETTTTTEQAGILEDMPRLDYSGGASCPSLLLEPQRTNLITNSEYFDAWTKFNASITTNNATSPDGTTNANKLIPNTVATSHQVNQSVTGAAHTLSVFAKASEYQTLALFYTVHDGRAVFNLNAGTITEETGTVTAKIEDYGSGWYRCSLSTTLTTHDAVRIYAINGTTWADVNTAGDGTSGVYIYGAMLEAGSYSTSLIPTYGASVTRSFDDCTIANVSSLLGSGTGTAYVDLVVDGADTQGNIFLTLGVNTQNLVYLWIQTSRTITYEAYESGGLTANISTSSGFYTYGDRIKVAAVWADNDFAMYINGTLIGTDTSGTAPTPTKLWLGQYTGGNYKGATINQAILFPTRLTNDELADLTTL